MIYRTDYHIHTTFSDGKADPEEYVSQAVSAGMKEIGFSEHLNLYMANQHWCMDPGRIHDYISHIDRMRKSEKEIEVRTGLEIDYVPGMEDNIYRFVKDLDLDYLIGSVHYLGETTVDSSPDFFLNKDIDEVYETYFSVVNEAVACGLFDIIAHCDLVRIYNHVPSSSPEHLYRKLAEKMRLHDIAFEINTNGRNRPLGDFYPDRRFLKLFNDEKVPVCVNSDSHVPQRVGQNFDEAYLLLKEAGYNEMAVFSKRERFIVPADFNLL